MPYSEAVAERAFRLQTQMDRLSYHWQDERSASFERARPEVADKPAEPQPEDLPAETMRPTVRPITVLTPETWLSRFGRPEDVPEEKRR